jgi:hypothetical protein
MFLYNTDAKHWSYKKHWHQLSQGFHDEPNPNMWKGSEQQVHSSHQNMPKTHTEEHKQKKVGGLDWWYPHENCSPELQSKEVCLHLLHKNCSIYTHTRHPTFTNYNTGHKAEENFVKSYHHVRHDVEIFPTVTLFSVIAWIHLRGHRNSQNIRFTCCSMQFH